MSTMEEQQLTGQANQEIENNLSSVKITHNSKGTTWEIKAKSVNPWAAMEVSCKIDKELRKRYEK